MIVSMFAFATTDMFIKLAASSTTPPQVMFFLTVGSFIVFVSIALIQKDKIWDRNALSPVLLLRYFAEVIGMVGMILALRYIPLSTVGAIVQSVPLLVALGAVLTLGERVSWRRWSSIVVGFIGVLLIIQPGADGFELTVLWAVLAAIGLSVRDLTTRLTPPNMSSASLGAYSMIAAISFSVFWLAFSGESFIPQNEDWVIVLPMVSFGAFGYLVLVASVRMAEVSVVTPYRYTRLIFLMVFGVVLFGEKPDAMVLLGAALIVVSGVYMMWRERVVQQ
tara:strand:+ start:4615 stop:5448 length:834 start_codon:yes stop_codon:yes gene_type:complete